MAQQQSKSPFGHSGQPRAKIRTPFGQADCESELEVLKSDYSKVYFDETPFNSAAIDPDTYLIIGRRGSGKTALAQYFSFQKVISDPLYIDVNEPTAYEHVLSDIAARASTSREIAIPRLKKVWEYVVWCVLFEHTRAQSSVIATACDGCRPVGRVSQMINSLMERLMAVFRDTNSNVVDVHLDHLLAGPAFDEAKKEVCRLAQARPVIVAIDTLERYDSGSDSLMNAMAALVQCAATFNVTHSQNHLHLKVFMSGEVFPYLREEVIQNPLKSIKTPVYLLWRPKDLLRLISWRFYQFLERHDLLKPASAGQIDWEDYHVVMQKMWTPYFGEYVTNGLERQEQTFAYVLRHTQMRPRQLILLCNAIAVRAGASGTFPNMSEHDIRLAVREAEVDLAGEILNSFSAVYPGVSTIVDALMKMPMRFTGNELDQRAKQSASEWPIGTYTPARFRRLVTELGIVGRVKRQSRNAGYIDAEFEYSRADRLPITHRDDCVIHPMFYSRLNIEMNSDARVMPFSTEYSVNDVDD